MTEKLAFIRGRREPSSRHSMYVLRQDAPDLSFADAVKNHDALLTSIYGSRSVDQQHLTTGTTKADISTLGNAGRPKSAISIPPVLKSSTSSVWQPLFHHTTLVGSAAPLLATFKRDTHVQTEDEIRNDVGVQTEEAEIRPATYKRDVLVQTGEEWVDFGLGGGGDVRIGRNSENPPNFAGDTCSTSSPCVSPRRDYAIEGYNTPNQTDISFPLCQEENTEKSPQQLRVNIRSADPIVFYESTNLSPREANRRQLILSNDNFSCHPENSHLSLLKTGKSELSYFPPHKPHCAGELVSEDFGNAEFPQLESDSLPQECPSSKCFTTYEVITLQDPHELKLRCRDSCSNESETVPSPPSQKSADEKIPSRALSPNKQKSRENRISLNMDDRLSSCSASERGSVISVFDALYADSFRFESCENLDQLEEEIIRSLCTPVKEMEDNSKPAFEENCLKDPECFPTIPYSFQRVEEIPRFFSNMSDQQKTEYHSDPKLCMRGIDSPVNGVRSEITVYSNPNAKLTPEESDDHASKEDIVPRPSSSCSKVPAMTDNFGINLAFGSNDEIRSLDGMKTPTKIDRRGMQARGEMIEKLMKGESVDTGALRNFDENSVVNHEDSFPPEGNEITVDLLSPQSAVPPGTLEVRRSSWSAVASTTHGTDPTEKANGEIISRVQSPRTDNSATERQNYGTYQGEHLPQNPSSEYNQDRINATHPKRNVPNSPVDINRPSYWPMQRNGDSDPKVRSEVRINLAAPNGSSSQRQCFDPSEVNTDTNEKVTACIPTPSPSLPPPPPPPPPPQQCYQSSFPKTDGISVDGVAKENANSSRPRTSPTRNSSPLPSRQKDLMMQELAERFQKRQKDSTAPNDDQRSSRNESINRAGNNLPSYCHKDDANITSPHSLYTQKEPNCGNNTNNSPFKPVWSSTNGEDYIDHNGRDAVNNSAEYKYKNRNQYNNSHFSQEAPPEPEVKYHPVGGYSSDSPYTGGQHNESHSYSNKDDTKHSPSYSRTTILTDEPPPRGAVLVDQKVTVEGDQIHTDKYYAVPVKEVLKEKTSTAKFTPAPPKYVGIGPTDDGVPTGLRQSVKKENMSNWYKTMFKSLHQAGHPHYGGYSSDPEFEREETAIISKSATLNNRQKPSDPMRQTISRIPYGYPPSAKSTMEVYNVHPRPIEDYEPGYSSAVDNENTTGSKRFLPSLNHPKPSYEFKSGYESDTSIIRKLNQPDGPHPEQQKLWYREIQKGGDIPQYGLGKLAPERPKEPVIGPAPSPTFQGSVKPNYPQAVRPHTPPPEQVISNDSNPPDVSNGNYSVQMQHAIHTELQRRMSPPSSQQTAGYKTSPKSPSKSPELKMLAKVLYDFISETPRELNLKKDELVLILKQLDKNWYEGERKGAVGIFPVSYVEILPPEHVSPQVKQPLEGLAKAVYDFRAQTSVELPLKKGDTVTLIRRVDQNWYEGRIQNKKGIFPATYVQVVQEPDESGRSSLSPTPKAPRTADSPHSIRVQEKSVKKSPTSCPTPPPSHSTPHTNMGVSNSPNNCGRTKKGSSLVEPILYRALYGYCPQNADELELLESDNVYVVEMCDDGWFVGTSVRTGVFGIFPGNYVEKV